MNNRNTLITACVHSLCEYTEFTAEKKKIKKNRAKNKASRKARRKNKRR